MIPKQAYGYVNTQPVSSETTRSEQHYIPGKNPGHDLSQSQRLAPTNLLPPQTPKSWTLHPEIPQNPANPILETLLGSS